MRPLLFLLHINDMPSVVDPGTSVHLFADETLIYRVIHSIEDQGIMELSFPRTFAPWNFHSRELSLPRTFVPVSETDVKLSLPGTYVPWNFRSHSQRNVVSLPNTNYDYLIVKLMVLRRYSWFVSLYSFIVVKNGRI